ncbi:hypothetical protein DSCW_57630 [Desulfosarcina widdelii]|uniref:ABC transporter substrate-binding protein n=1 Tax=Desulfosarcina widdelii TaxID=947919 RepID=A0A5K7Z924_9BACT|nr:hypothetical protein DSCW_57630 [Desulfosarcina widdelii]
MNISAYNKGYKWTDDCVKGISSVLEDRYNLVTIYMNTKVLSKGQHQESADKSWNAYKEIKPDLVMLGDDNALYFLGPKFADSDVPVVFYGVNANPRKYFKDKSIPKNITGILERVPIYAVLRIVKPLLKNAKNMLLLFDDSPTSDAAIETMLDGKNHISIANFDLYSKRVCTFKAWRDTIIQAQQKYDTIYLSTLFTIKDEDGRCMNPPDVLAWSSKHTKIPLFGSQESMVHNDGVLGAIVIVGEKHGQMAAEMASHILEGDKIPIHIMHKDSEILLNRRQLEKFNIDLPDSISKFSRLN